MGACTAGIDIIQYDVLGPFAYKRLFRTIMHEFMHALGLYHMQSRPDRDNYVEIKWDNIQSGKEGNFQKCDSCLTYDVGYDAKSFMHYRSYYFAIDNSKPTIESKVATLLENCFLLLK